MQILKLLQKLSILILQFISIFIFILIEEIIWEGIAKPIYEKIYQLKIIRKIELLINSYNRYIILSIFLLLLVSVELVGIMAGVFFIQGYILLGTLLYIIKIPIAAFVFWLFKITKDKLLSFQWFNWIYLKLIFGTNWLKNHKIYQSINKKFILLKGAFKTTITNIKKRYFSQNSKFITELKLFYKYIKTIIKK